MSGHPAKLHRPKLSQKVAVSVVFVAAYIVSGPVGEVVDAIRRRRTKHTESEKLVHGTDTHTEDPR